MSVKEKYKYGHECFARDGHWRGVNGFREAWLDAFVQRIAQRFDDARKSAVSESSSGESQALMRLDNALVKVQHYVSNKYKKKIPSLSSSGGTGNAEGTRRGRAAADALKIGQRGITGTSPRGLLK